MFDIFYLYFEVVRLSYAVRGNTLYDGNTTRNGYGHGNGKRKCERNLQYTRLRPEYAYTFVRTRYLLRLSVRILFGHKVFPLPPNSMSLEGVGGGWAVVPIIYASIYGDIGVSVNVGALAVELGGGVFVMGEE